MVERRWRLYKSESRCSREGTNGLEIGVKWPRVKRGVQERPEKK